MKLAALPDDVFHRRLSSRSGLRLRVGPFSVAITTDISGLATPLRVLHADQVVLEEDEVADFHAGVKRPRSLRRWIAPQALFVTDDWAPFEPFPLDHALPLLEWGLNWCIASRAHSYLQLHSAVAERGGRALLMPAFPGSGKSTLSSALMFRDWNLLSDEFGLIDQASAKVVSIPRPVPLKNASIEIIRRFDAAAVIGPEFPNTRKGTVAHLKPTSSSAETAGLAYPVRWVVFPKYSAGSDNRLARLDKANALMRVCGNSFNYGLVGERGFAAAGNIIDHADCFELQFSDLDEAIRLLTVLSDEA